LLSKEKARMVVKYVDKEMKQFWKRLDGYGTNYEKLKKDILGTYSKTLLDDKPTVNQLNKFIKKSVKAKVEDEEDLDAYFRKFWIIAADLVDAQVISEKQFNEYFWKGIPRNLRYEICDCLEA
jgi:hypothetical protein